MTKMCRGIHCLWAHTTLHLIRVRFHKERLYSWAMPFEEWSPAPVLPLCSSDRACRMACRTCTTPTHPIAPIINFKKPEAKQLDVSDVSGQYAHRFYDLWLL